MRSAKDSRWSDTSLGSSVGDVHGLENGVLGGQGGFDLSAQLLGVEEILDAQADTVHLVGVGGADASARRADQVVAARTLVRLVHEAGCTGG